MASREGENVGCVALLLLEDGFYELSRMAVLPRLRKQGNGPHLLAHVIREARLLGAASLCLATNTKSKNAIDLYEAAGFLHVPRQELPPLPYTRANVFSALTLRTFPADSASVCTGGRKSNSNRDVRQRDSEQKRLDQLAGFRCQQ